MYEVEHQVVEGVPSYHEEPADRTLMNPPPKLTFSHDSYGGDSSGYSCAS